MPWRPSPNLFPCCMGKAVFSEIKCEVLRQKPALGVETSGELEVPSLRLLRVTCRYVTVCGKGVKQRGAFPLSPQMSFSLEVSLWFLLSPSCFSPSLFFKYSSPSVGPNFSPLFSLAYLWLNYLKYKGGRKYEIIRENASSYQSATFLQARPLLPQ